MSTRDPRQPYQDILESISNIEGLIQGMDYETFCADNRTVWAIEHLLLVIAEAAMRLRGQPLPEKPWRDIRNMGNWIRHQYDVIDLKIVWDTATEDLQPLEKSCCRTWRP